ncbi:hypothetical protein FACUT_1352 [Fusarium acutatum]|uniref:Uncharacterized protein n=1 Tax=Fusarium acutatum TaxID=78861 RepID=A0A8H4K613_9HYPO|nr:hypothetical protein FACUT_1352 [Fusarium acutatum]
MSPYQITYGYWNSMLKSILDQWNTNLHEPADPILPPCLMEHPFIEAGTLTSDQPIPNSKRRACKVAHVHDNKGFGVPGIDDPANEPAVAPITKYDNPAPDEYQKAPKFQSKVGQSVELESTPITAKFAWTAGQNKLADDAARRASKACPNKTQGHSIAYNVDMAMAHHLDAFRARQFENSHPVRVFASLFEFARGIAQADKQTWSEAIAAWNEKKKDLHASAVNRVKHKAVPRQGCRSRPPVEQRVCKHYITWPILVYLIHPESNMGQKRTSEWDAELLKQHEARKKGQPAYYTVTVNKGSSLQFS